MSTMNLPLETLRGLYDDTELAIVFDWLGRERPSALAAIDTEATIQPHPGPTQSGPVRLLVSYDGYDYSHETRLANAVARIALNAIADRLPQWMTRLASGEMAYARAPQPRRLPTVELMPRFLLMINWADSGPGYSWPESYHATCLPGFDCFVVTLSDDSPEMHGYTDMAIGHFPADANFDAEVERIICDLWLANGAGDPELAWAHLWDPGYIDVGTAYAWRDRVWGPEPEDEALEDDPDDTAQD